MFDHSPGEEIRFLPGAVHIIQTKTSFEMLEVHPSDRVAIASIKLEMLLFEFFRPRRDALFPRHDRKLCTAGLSDGLFAPQ